MLSSLPASFTPRPWWGEYSLDEGQLCRWKIGSLSLWIQRRTHEWRLSTKNGDDPLDGQIEHECPSSAEPPEDVTLHRIAVRSSEAGFELQPALADRPVVAQPQTPLYLLAGDGVTIYLSTPLWIELKSGTPRRLLQELPSHRPSDTWFGPSTTEGELCYASRTSARLTLADMPFHPVRAVTAVQLENKSSERMLLERMNLPVPYLSLFVDAKGLFWTQSVTIERDENGDTAQVRLGSRPPAEVPEPRLVHGPRLATNRNVFVRAFGALLG